jgi:DNA-binding MltR family transcriptional regulator
MLELNIFSAVALGSFSAAVWAIVSIRRLLRATEVENFSIKQRLIVWAAAAVAFIPSLFVAFAGCLALSNFTVQPGPWNQLALNLTLVFGLGFIGTAMTWVAAKLAAFAVRSKKVAS